MFTYFSLRKGTVHVISCLGVVWVTSVTKMCRGVKNNNYLWVNEAKFTFQLQSGLFLWLSSHYLHCFQQHDHSAFMPAHPVSCAPWSSTPISLSVPAPKVGRQTFPGEVQQMHSLLLAEFCFFIFSSQQVSKDRAILGNSSSGILDALG